MVNIVERSEFFQSGRDNALIPFYSADPIQVEAFYLFIDKFREFNNVNVVVVNDGTSGLEVAKVNAGLIIQAQDGLNHGKAEAIRLGLITMLHDPRYSADYFVQYNGDSDQSYLEPPKLLTRVKDLCEFDPTQSALVVGERYSRKLETPPNPDSIEYRQSVLILQKAIAGRWGYPVSDWVSGSRAFTSGYARRFLEMSSSQFYGVEAEELTVAYLIGAKVGIEPLVVSRPRDPNTNAGKLLQMLDAILAHKDLLNGKGQKEVVDLLEVFKYNIINGVDQFSVDLNSIDFPAVINCKRRESGYAVFLPEEIVNQHFDTSLHPFAFRHAI